MSLRMEDIHVHQQWSSAVRAAFKFQTLGVAVACLLYAGGDLGFGQCVYQDANGHPYLKEFRPFVPQSGTAAGPDLKIVALGDSVVWGDGDKPRHKIVWLVGQGVANYTGHRVLVHSYAHSGARLSYSDPGSDPTFPVDNDVPLGDLGSERPTTSEQADCAAVDDSDAVYVLLDGCINEVGAGQIALPPIVLLPNLRTTPEQIRSDVLKYCSANMATTLLKITQQFPHARVVMLGYFRVVSDVSKPEPEMTDAEKAQLKAENAKQEKAMERVVKRDGDFSNLTGSRAAKKKAIQAEVQKWWANSDEFLKDSTSCFKWAIDSVNAGVVGPISAPAGVSYSDSAPESDWKPVCPVFDKSTVAPGSPPPIAVAAAAFPDNPEYSYGAPHTHLWLLPLPFISQDEMYWTRAWQCTLHLCRGDKTCYTNAIAHPKPIGAQCYSESILGAIGFVAPKPDSDCQPAKTAVATR